jgi:pimeloyl-ACP methyl ester carboxylesterase
MFGVCTVIAPKAEAVTRPVAGRMAMFSVIVARPWRLEPKAAAHAVRALAGASTFRDTLDRITAERCQGFEDIRCPVRIAWGSRDWLLPARQGPRFVRVIPNAEHRPLPGLGHVPMSDDPQMVARAILDPIGPSPSEPG